MDGKAKEIMEVVTNIKSMPAIDAEGLLGFCISEEIDSYRQTGMSLIATFKRHPEQAELIEEVVVSICGWSMDSLLNLMKERESYYHAL